MRTVSATKRVEIDAGHRLMGHGGKCGHLHGHRYAFEVTVEAERLDDVGRVVDFDEIKAHVARVVEPWDHATILRADDPLLEAIRSAEPHARLVALDVNPTAENLASIVGHVVRSLLTFEDEAEEVERPNPRRVRVVSVVCWETPTGRAEWRP